MASRIPATEEESPESIEGLRMVGEFIDKIVNIVIPESAVLKYNEKVVLLEVLSYLISIVKRHFR